MGRTVLTRKDVAALTAQAKERKTLAFAAGGTLASDATPTTPSAPEPDTYRDRLIKYIPSDVVAIYLSLIGLSKLLQDGPQHIAQWVTFVVVLIISVPWQWKVAKITKWSQIVIGSGAFLLWAISLGDPFKATWHIDNYEVYTTMATVLYTFLIALVEA